MKAVKPAMVHAYDHGRPSQSFQKGGKQPHESANPNPAGLLVWAVGTPRTRTRTLVEGVISNPHGVRQDRAILEAGSEALEANACGEVLVVDVATHLLRCKAISLARGKRLSWKAILVRV